MAKVAKKGYFINPIVRTWLEAWGISQTKLCKKSGANKGNFSSALQQKATVGPDSRVGIIRELNILFQMEAGKGEKARKVTFAEIFSKEKYLLL